VIWYDQSHKYYKSIQATFYQQYWGKHLHHPQSLPSRNHMTLNHLPILHVIPQLQDTLRTHSLALLTAEPGAGKTTQVPLALIHEPWLGNKKILMLEPRRLAARMAATYIARLLNESVGKTVGYRTRLDTKISSATQIEVVTEGILTRILQHDPSLNEYGLVIFDEFHERSLQADLGLALTLQSQSLFRPDLRLLIMSATLDLQSLTPQLLKDAPVLTCEGSRFPVDTRYSGPLEKSTFTQHVARLIQNLLRTESGNLLVFLPGVREIQQVNEHLAQGSLPHQVLLAPLYGNLPSQAQDQAILPPPTGWRKIVLATNIAETSLTIEGIRVVLDTGLMRVPRFDVRSGMSRLVTIPISQQSAEQRRGRAGRLEPGLCIRCWSEATQRTLAIRTPPEILEADLTALALELAVWGIHDESELVWLDSPPAGALAHARELLQFLGALDDKGQVTDQGRTMADLPLHPRLAHMIVRGTRMRLGTMACDLAAILSEPAFLKGTTAQGLIDLRLRMEEYLHQVNRSITSGIVQRISHTSQSWQRKLRIGKEANPSKQDHEDLGILLALAYPDRIAQQQSDGSRRYKMANGRLVQFHQPHPLEHDEFLVIADLDGVQPISRIYLAAPILRDDLVKHFSERFQAQDIITWNPGTQSVLATKLLRLGELILKESRLHKPDPDVVMATLIEGIRQHGISCLPWSKDQRHWQSRVQFLHRAMKTETAWPDVRDDALLQTLEIWLAPYLTDLTNLSQVQRVDLTWPLQALLSAEQRRSLESLAPTHLSVPSGSRIALDYQSGEIPILAVRLQEVFGMTKTPTVANGQIPVLLHLLSPARRPVQVTQDLQSFWNSGYAEVKKDLKGRYPKHFWPDDPLQAPPTRGIKKRI